MGTHDIDTSALKSVLNQIAGNVGKNETLLPEVGIKGKGYIWCYDVVQKKIVRVIRQTKCYILNDTIDDSGRILIYTLNNDVILIKESEIIYTGYD